MRPFPTRVRWAAAALAVAACAGLSGCMSVGDESARPAPGASGGKPGASAEPDGGGTGQPDGGGGAYGGGHGDRPGGPDAAGG
ncbi:hypothetical protein ACFXHD_42335, partial [Streptomyces hydrogenans]